MLLRRVKPPFRLPAYLTEHVINYGFYSYQIKEIRHRMRLP